MPNVTTAIPVYGSDPQELLSPASNPDTTPSSLFVYANKSKSFVAKSDVDIKHLVATLEGLNKTFGNQFKPNGIAASAIKQYNDLCSSLLRVILDLDKGNEELSKTVTSYRKSNHEFAESLSAANAEIEILKNQKFDMSQFSQFCTGLYSVLGKDGPEIRATEDLPVFQDFVYKEIIKSNQYEPELP